MTLALQNALASSLSLTALANANIAANGFCTVSQQYGATASNAANGAYQGPDQWWMNAGGTNVVSIAQVTNPFPSYPGIANGIRALVTTAEASLGVNSFLSLCQNIEGNRISRLNWGTGLIGKPLSIGFIARPNIDMVIYVAIIGASPAQTFLRRYTLTANTDNFVDLSGSLAIPASSTGSWPTDSTLGLSIRINFGGGTNLQGPTGAWQTTGGVTGNDATNLMAAVNNQVVISGLVMLPGLVLPPKDVWHLLARHYDDELRLCMRYWQFVGASIAQITVPSGSTMAWPVPLQVPMRAIPSVAVSGVAGGGTTSVVAQSPSMLMYRLSSTYGAADNNCTANATCVSRL